MDTERVRRVVSVAEFVTCDARWTQGIKIDHAGIEGARESSHALMRLSKSPQLVSIGYCAKDVRWETPLGVVMTVLVLGCSCNGRTMMPLCV